MRKSVISCPATLIFPLDVQEKDPSTYNGEHEAVRPSRQGCMDRDQDPSIGKGHLEPIGDIPPVEFEAIYSVRQRSHATAVRLSQTSLRRSRGSSLRHSGRSAISPLGFLTTGFRRDLAYADFREDLGERRRVMEILTPSCA